MGISGIPYMLEVEAKSSSKNLAYKVGAYQRGSTELDRRWVNKSLHGKLLPLTFEMYLKQQSQHCAK